MLSFTPVRAMVWQVDTVCGRYQKARVVRGVAGCSNPRYRCEYGPHRCGKCGDEGHGWADCEGRWPPLEQPPFWVYKATPINVPPVPPPPIRSRTMPTATPPVDGTPRSKSKPPTPRMDPPTTNMAAPPVHDNVASGFAQPPPASQASGSAQPPPASQVSGTSQHIEAIPMKGYGKGANLGIELPLPMPISFSSAAHSGPLPQTVPMPLQAWGDEAPLPLGCPPPFKPDGAYVGKWFTDEFTPLVNTTQVWPPGVGDQVLWKSVYRTKTGHESGKLEYFNGKVHAVENDDTGQIFLHVC